MTQNGPNKKYFKKILSFNFDKIDLTRNVLWCHIILYECNDQGNFCTEAMVKNAFDQSNCIVL